MEALTPATRNAIAVGVVLGLITFYIIRGQSLHETLTGMRKSDKASSIIGWFRQNSTPTYTKYKDAFAEPNIVEYEDMLALHQAGDLTQKSAEERLR